MKRRRKNNEGQAAIEFIVVVVVVFFFLFFMLSLSMALVVSDYVEYATFMAARTYKAGFRDEEIQERRARQVFTAYTERINGVARNFDLQFVNESEERHTAGVIATYELDLFYLPPLFIIDDDQPISRITLTSEVLLGRDPPFQECKDFFNDFAGRFGIGASEELIEQMADNGC